MKQVQLNDLINTVLLRTKNSKAQIFTQFLASELLATYALTH